MYFDSLEQCFQSCPSTRFARTPRDYGSRLAAVIVKYQAEAARAENILGRPVHVVRNGVPLPPTALPPRSGSPVIVFGTAARINPQKRLEDLLSAFRLVHKSLPSSVLTIAGGIEQGCETYAADLKTMAHDLPVIWHGEITDLAAFHAALDIFVMISDPAGCPNASLEAMAAGLPLVATDVGGASEQVINGLTGHLVPSRDPVALSGAMISLARRSDLWPLLGQAARTHIQTQFSLERMIANYRRILLPRNGPEICSQQL
jgi:glycosyltransferase involved in cell wall biosynthesis